MIRIDTLFLTHFLEVYLFFFFSSRRLHTISYGDWSSDVCSSDLSRQVDDVPHALPLHLVDERGGDPVRLLVARPGDEEDAVGPVQRRRKRLRPLEVEFHELGCVPGAAPSRRRLSGGPPYPLAPPAELHDEPAADCAGRPDHENRSRHQSTSTACVCTTSATRRPVASRTSDCSTIVRRPTWSACVTASMWPLRTGAKKFVFDSMVEVPAPGGRFKKAQIAPSVSASAMIAPPCNVPPLVQRSGAQARRPRTSSALAAVTSAPTATAKGMAAARACGSGAAMATRTGSSAEPPASRSPSRGSR